MRRVCKMLNILRNACLKAIVEFTIIVPRRHNFQMSPDTIVGVWKDTYLDPKMDKWQNYIEPITKKGYQVVLSACWYLNYISYGPDWKNYYECDPRGFNGNN